MIGAMLIYDAFNPPVRALALTVAGVSKLVFVALVLSQGTRYLGQQAGIAIDAVWVIVFAVYLVGARRQAGSASAT